jgi:hypothetical protein
MAYKKTFCANEACSKHTIYSGGQFIYSAERRGMFCSDCFHGRGSRLPSVAKSAFDFVTSTITGKPIHVESMQHLQRLETEHGCSSVVLNCDRGNWDRPKMPRENWQQSPGQVLPHGVTVGEVRR